MLNKSGRVGKVGMLASLQISEKTLSYLSFSMMLAMTLSDIISIMLWYIPFITGNNF